ncbi:uncharacterized protein [Coffea arabica]|uniref:Uncharacterized protein n=1 Tax=Coffea arabica TaxID=13443 RepID=A0ABM4WN35_COFAR
MAVLSKVLSKSVEALRKGLQFEWTSECQKAFDELKARIVKLPTLTSPGQGETLLVYLSVREKAISVVLIREKNKVQKPVYYAHPIVVVTNQPLKQILSKSNMSRRMVIWAMELSEYDLGYQPRMAIRAHALADFIAEGVSFELQGAEQTTGRTEAREAKAKAELAKKAAEQAIPTWTLYIDGVSNKEGCGVGLLLISPTGEKLAYALRFDFRASNNESEYEALITRIEVARKLGAELLKVHSDSQLKVNHVLEKYEIKKEPLKKHVAKTHELRSLFNQFTLEQVPRSRNKRADALSKLVSTSFGTLNKEILVDVVKRRAYEQLESAVIQESRWPDEEGNAIPALLAYHLPGFDRIGGKVQVMPTARTSSSRPNSGDSPSLEPVVVLPMKN